MFVHIKPWLFQTVLLKSNPNLDDFCKQFFLQSLANQVCTNIIKETSIMINFLQISFIKRFHGYKEKYYDNNHYIGCVKSLRLDLHFFFFCFRFWAQLRLLHDLTINDVIAHVKLCGIEGRKQHFNLSHLIQLGIQGKFNPFSFSCNWPSISATTSFI